MKLIPRIALFALAIGAGFMFAPLVTDAQTVHPSTRARTWTATAPSGVNGFACVADGCRVDLGTGANDYLYSDGTNIRTNAGLIAGYFSTAAAATSIRMNGLYGYTSGAVVTVQGNETDAVDSIAVRITNGTALTNAGAKIVAFYSDNGVTEQASISTFGVFRQTGMTFANLGAPANGAIIYCTDCTFANPCGGGGTGAFAKRLNGAWRCD